jgi:hypothetical protein
MTPDTDVMTPDNPIPNADSVSPIKKSHGPSKLSAFFRRVFFLEQWIVGYARTELQTFLDDPKSIEFDWIVPSKRSQFLADPFGYEENGRLNILCEQYDHYEGKGDIIELREEHAFDLGKRISLLRDRTHYSYPFTIVEEGRLYVVPENFQSSAVTAYKYKNGTLEKSGDLLDKPVLDSTVLRHDGKYWLFCTIAENNQNNDLHIFHATNFLGPYESHVNNPVKSNVSGSRPAGAFFHYDGRLLRPSQDGSTVYGGAVEIAEVATLTIDDYAEKPFLRIEPRQTNGFRDGLHTINSTENYVLIDTKRQVFHPLTPFMKVFFRLRLTWRQLIENAA